VASTTLDACAHTAPAPPRRPPAAVLAAGAVAAVQAVALVAGALTGLDGLLVSPSRPSGPVVAVLLLLLAGWVVLCAGGGALLVDGSGARMLAGVAYAEFALVGGFVVLSLTSPLLDGLPASLPLPALALLLLAVPVGKLLLVGAPSAVAWVAAGPRARRAPDPGPVRGALRTGTVAVIGLGLVALALATPVPPGGTDAPAPAGVTGAP
jgi:hypothetical protein